MKRNEDAAEEYAAGMMGEPYEYWVHHADRTLFNTIKKAYRAGALNNVAIENIKKINALKPTLIEALLRRDYMQAMQIVEMI